jgi:hypothetical protein
MIGSNEKVRQAVNEMVARLPELQQQASGMQAVELAGLALIFPRAAAMLLEQLPAADSELDELLEKFGYGVLGLRSDPAPDVDTVAIAIPEPLAP